MTFVYSYYDNPNALRRQMRCWADWPIQLVDSIVVVDCCSPKTPATEAIKGICLLHQIEVHRLAEHKGWNMAGAFNYGCQRAKGWIFTSGMNSILAADNLDRLHNALDFLDRNAFMPARISIHGRPMKPSLVNLCFHRSAFDKIGGYKESFSGHYGFEELDFFMRLKTVRTVKNLPDVKVTFLPDWIEPDTRATELDRDLERNLRLYLSLHPKPIRC